MPLDVVILLAHRYTRGALAISSNLEFADWTPIFNDDARMVAALLDRLTHRCHLLEFRAESYRFRQSLAGREESMHGSDDLKPARTRTLQARGEQTYER